MVASLEAVSKEPSGSRSRLSTPPQCCVHAQGHTLSNAATAPYTLSLTCCEWRSKELRRNADVRQGRGWWIFSVGECPPLVGCAQQLTTGSSVRRNTMLTFLSFLWRGVFGIASRGSTRQVSARCHACIWAPVSQTLLCFGNCESLKSDVLH